MASTKKTSMSKQLALAIQPNDEITLANFSWASNALLEQQLQALLSFSGERFLYLWGMPGSGKSHILQASCQAFNSTNRASYLPLALLKDWGVQVLENLDEQTLICIDDIHLIAGCPLFEEGLFHLYNRIRENENALLILSGRYAPANMPIKLPDLRSRLSGGLVMQLNELNDDEKIEVLIRHANQRGFELTTTVAQFLINRFSRNMHNLYAILKQLDESSLAARRKITIPFVKAALQLE
jgi:DnaA family protein